MCLWSINTDTRCSGFTLKISGPVSGPLCAFQLSSTNHSCGLCGEKAVWILPGDSPQAMNWLSRRGSQQHWSVCRTLTWHRKTMGYLSIFFLLVHLKSKTLMVCCSFFSVSLKSCSRLKRYSRAGSSLLVIHFCIQLSTRTLTHHLVAFVYFLAPASVKGVNNFHVALISNKDTCLILSHCTAQSCFHYTMLFLFFSECSSFEKVCENVLQVWHRIYSYCCFLQSPVEYWQCRTFSSCKQDLRNILHC